MNWGGILLGAASFVIIGLFHPIVIWAEYHFGKGCWPVFLAVGLLLAAASLTVSNLYAGALWPFPASGASGNCLSRSSG